MLLRILKMLPKRNISKYFM